jgi:hypothetical protein
MQEIPTVRVLFASMSRVEGSVMDALFGVRNRIVCDGSVTRAALHYTSGWFLFWLEGTPESVDRWMRDADEDERIHHSLLIHKSTGPATLAEPIQISAAQGPDRPADFARRVHRARDSFLEPAEIWNRLTAPRFAGELSDAPTAAPHGELDMLRHLARARRAPTVYQRFAGSRLNSVDTGGAYVDVTDPTGTTRVQLLARRGLPNQLVRLSLGQLDHLALVLCNHEPLTLDLATSVADYLQAQGSAPAVSIVSSDAEIAGAACAVLREKAGCVAMRLPEAGYLEALLATTGGTAGMPVPPQGVSV